MLLGSHHCSSALGWILRGRRLPGGAFPAPHLLARKSSRSPSTPSYVYPFVGSCGCCRSEDLGGSPSCFNLRGSPNFETHVRGTLWLHLGRTILLSGPDAFSSLRSQQWGGVRRQTDRASDRAPGSRSGNHTGLSVSHAVTHLQPHHRLSRRTPISMPSVPHIHPGAACAVSQGWRPATMPRAAPAGRVA
jgi:hypothetical protein